MDYDNDGVLDFISGSYDPGDVYLFRGLGDGEYAKVETILDEDEYPLVHHPAELATFMEMETDSDADSDEAIQMRIASFGSWAAPADWDADGDLDMLIGSFSGGLYLRTNIGTRDEPKYSRESIVINVNGEPLKEKCHANPVVVDWDGDGKWDLVVGSGDGSVGWYRNIGTASQPEFGSRNLLVKRAAEMKFLKQNLKPGEDPVPGVRAQICVTDYNLDGLPDLLVGDHSDINWTKPLSKQEQAEFEKLKLEQTDVGDSLSKLQTIIYGEDTDEEVKTEKESEYQELVGRFQKLSEKRKSFYVDSRSASFLWLYLRKSQVGPQTFVSAKTNDAQPQSAEAATSRPAEDEPAGDAGPVEIDVKLEPGKKEGSYTLAVTFDVQPLWHLYASVPDGSGNRVAKVELQLPDGIETTGPWQKPEGQVSLTAPDTRIYEGSVTFSRPLEVTSKETVGAVELAISYQVCNESLCLPPKTITESVKLPRQ